jgi:hypothetical protein
MLLLMVSQYVLVSSSLWNLRPDIILCLEVAVLSLWGALHLKSSSCTAGTDCLKPFIQLLRVLLLPGKRVHGAFPRQRPSISKSKLYYDRQSVGQSALVSGTHLEPPTNVSPFSLIMCIPFRVCCGLRAYRIQYS